MDFSSSYLSEWNDHFLSVAEFIGTVRPLISYCLWGLCGNSCVRALVDRVFLFVSRVGLAGECLCFSKCSREPTFALTVSWFVVVHQLSQLFVMSSCCCFEFASVSLSSFLLLASPLLCLCPLLSISSPFLFEMGSPSVAHATSCRLQTSAISFTISSRLCLDCITHMDMLAVCFIHLVQTIFKIIFRLFSWDHLFFNGKRNALTFLNKVSPSLTCFVASWVVEKGAETVSAVISCLVIGYTLKCGVGSSPIVVCYQALTQT